jgi:hypothetical protein
MKSLDHYSPKLAFWLLDKCLPESVKDDVVGDLSEEFIRASETTERRHLELWQQTISACWRYAPRNKTFIQSFLIALFTVAISYVLIQAVMVLSVLDEPVLYGQEYWFDGNIHLLFADPLFWSIVTTEDAYSFDLYALVDDRSYSWAISCFFAISILGRRINISVLGYSIFTVLACGLPYLYGVYHFYFVGLGIKEAGPMIALMWIPTLYVLLPMSIVIIRALYANNIAEFSVVSDAKSGQ